MSSGLIGLKIRVLRSRPKRMFLHANLNGRLQVQPLTAITLLVFLQQSSIEHLRKYLVLFYSDNLIEPYTLKTAP